METITQELKEKVVERLVDIRSSFDGSEMEFVRSIRMNGSKWNKLKSGRTRGILTNAEWLKLAREWDIQLNSRKWKLVKTDVYDMIEEDILFCQKYSKGRIFVDDCEIGKTEAALHLSKTLRNCFYIDCSQGKSKMAFIRLLAKNVGVEPKGNIHDIAENTKFYLNSLRIPPVVILDEAGDLEHRAFLEIKSYCNATKNRVGWYMIGADGLRKKIRSGMKSEKNGYKEIFSRFSSNFSSIVPTGKEQRTLFYQKLISDVLEPNVEDKSIIPSIVKKCLISEFVGGLRRADSLLILNNL